MSWVRSGVCILAILAFFSLLNAMICSSPAYSREKKGGKHKGKNAAALHYFGPEGMSQLKRLVWLCPTSSVNSVLLA